MKTTIYLLMDKISTALAWAVQSRAQFFLDAFGPPIMNFTKTAHYFFSPLQSQLWPHSGLVARCCILCEIEKTHSTETFMFLKSLPALSATKDYCVGSLQAHEQVPPKSPSRHTAAAKKSICVMWPQLLSLPSSAPNWLVKLYSNWQQRQLNKRT